MGSKWIKAKLALGLNLCMYTPRTLEDSAHVGVDSTERLSDAALLTPVSNLDLLSSRPVTPPPSSYRLRFSKTRNQSPKEICSICLKKMKDGGGHAIFTAECLHSFHFHCIASNVKHGNQMCPVCRANWKEIPMQGPGLGAQHEKPNGQFSDMVMTVGRRPRPRRDMTRRHIVPLQASEPGQFNDDEILDHVAVTSGTSSCGSSPSSIIDIKMYPEFTTVARTKSIDTFTVLVHLKAAGATAALAAGVTGHTQPKNGGSLLQGFRTPRAPVDLVTVLDISGSMAGTKIALLKRAMGFVIQNLGSNDRLSVIAFSSTARRLFPLCRMSESGRQLALQAVNSLVANGGTNIAEGLRKGVKVLEDRREKNPVANIILLSDGQDTYSISKQSQPNYQNLLPSFIRDGERKRFQIPVHVFGFGADHDASAMHSISEISGGTFSFIENEAVIQNAFAQCIGGLLSVVVQQLQVKVECMEPIVHLGSLKAGNYTSRVIDNGCVGLIDVGDLYADEERDFLASLNVPAETSRNGTLLLKVSCIYKDPLTEQMSRTESDVLKIERPELCGKGVVSIEVDRQRNRLQAAEVMAQARTIAEKGDLAAAVSVLENFRRLLSETVSAKSNDRLCIALDAELKEMQERMTSRHVYEESGRAYILSGLSSHSWQRATARGDSTDGSSLVQAYQTPSMTEMLTRSQTMFLGSPSNQRLLQPLLSLRQRKL